MKIYCDICPHEEEIPFEKLAFDWCPCPKCKIGDMHDYKAKREVIKVEIRTEDFK